LLHKNITTQYFTSSLLYSTRFFISRGRISPQFTPRFHSRFIPMPANHRSGNEITATRR